MCWRTKDRDTQPEIGSFWEEASYRNTTRRSTPTESSVFKPREVQRTTAQTATWDATCRPNVLGTLPYYTLKTTHHFQLLSSENVAFWLRILRNFLAHIMYNAWWWESVFEFGDMGMIGREIGQPYGKLSLRDCLGNTYSLHTHTCTHTRTHTHTQQCHRTKTDLTLTLFTTYPALFSEAIT